MQAVIFDLDETLFAAENALYVGVEELLTILQRLGVKVGALASGDHRVLVRLGETGIRQHFDHVVCSDHVAGPKEPQTVSQLMTSMGVEARHTVLISHMPSDIVLGKSVGLSKTIRVAHGSIRRSEQADADHIVQDIPSVLDVLE